ncbi:hypothetical protein [Streptomyces flavidovirens]
MTAPAWSALATSMAVIVALSIALLQHRAQQRALANAQRERASLIAIMDVDGNSVAIKNLGQAPFFRLRVQQVEASLNEEDVVDGVPEKYVVGMASAWASPHDRPVVPPGETVQFNLHWADYFDGTPISPEESERMGSPAVTFGYTDAAGTRWERLGHNRPHAVGGEPLPGALGIRRRLKIRWRRAHWHWRKLQRRYLKWKKEVERRRDERLGRPT